MTNDYCNAAKGQYESYELKLQKDRLSMGHRL